VYAEAKGSFIAAVTEQAVAQGYPRTATTPCIVCNTSVTGSGKVCP
jgi:hypothetical protein